MKAHLDSQGPCPASHSLRFFRLGLLGSSLCALFLFGATTAHPQDAGSLSAQEQALLLDIAVNRHAKRVCSGVFLSGRSAEEVLIEDHDTDPSSVHTMVDREHGIVSVAMPSMPGNPKGTAVFRNGLGCTILKNLNPNELRAQPTGRPTADPLNTAAPWPTGSSADLASPPGLQREALNDALDRAFAEPDATKTTGTRGVAVVYGGQLVAERYAQGFARDRPLIIWSMTKSLTNALVGLMVKDGRLGVHAKAPVTEWHQQVDDPRALITTDQLMRMSSGLKFEEVYEQGLIDVVVMLFGTGDTGQYAAEQPPEAAPDTRWHYSSGTTNIISRIIKGALADDLSTYVALPHERLLKPLGMRNTVLELDESGTFVGSSFAYSTPRDLARAGQLFLQDGVWQGERLLPEGWVEYSATPTPLAPRGSYGAQFWLNAGDPSDPAKRRWPDVPTDAYGMSGFEGQSVTIVPSRNAVIVRLGRTPDRSAFSLNRFLADVLATLPNP